MYTNELLTLDARLIFQEGMLIAQPLIEHNQSRFFVLLDVDAVNVYVKSFMYEYGVGYGSRFYFGKYGLRVVSLNSGCNFFSHLTPLICSNEVSQCNFSFLRKFSHWLEGI